MDILVSSNLERLVYHVSGPEDTKARMEQLSKEGKYFSPEDYPGFEARYASEEECVRGIKEMFDAGHVIDPHTAVAYESLKKLREDTGAKEPNVILSTASPFKFTESVCKAIDPGLAGISAMDGARKLASLGKTEIPRQIAELEWKKKRHGNVCAKEGMRQEALEFLRGFNG
jgi:threonine synthase